jgi:hypothetical protein
MDPWAFRFPVLCIQYGRLSTPSEGPASPSAIFVRNSAHPLRNFDQHKNRVLDSVFQFDWSYDGFYITCIYRLARSNSSHFETEWSIIYGDIARLARVPPIRSLALQCYCTVSNVFASM